MLKDRSYQPALGLLILRIGLGLLFLQRSWPKLAGGKASWAEAGAFAQRIPAVAELPPEAFGLALAFGEFAGAICLLTGAVFGPGCVTLLVVTLLMPFVELLSGGTLAGVTPPAVAAVSLTALLVGGPGKRK